MNTKVTRVNDLIEKEDNCFFLNKNNERKELTNFIANIVTDIAVYSADGKVEHYYELKGLTKNGTALTKITIPAKDFEKGDWIAKKWGTAAKVNFIPQSKLLVCEAILLNSKNIKQVEKYGYVGFIEKGDEKGYVTNAGCIFSNRFDPSLTSYLNNNLRHYSIHDCSLNKSEIHKYINSVFRLSEIFIENKIAPTLLTAHMFRSILGIFCVNEVSLYIVGDTGSFKTSICSVFQSFFGRNYNKNRDITFGGTANAIEAMSILIRHGPLLVDDFVTTSELNEKDDVAKYDSLFRGSANNSSKARCSSDGQLLNTPQNLVSILATGEHIALGAVDSCHKRIMYTRIEESYINLSSLLKAQTNAELGIFENVTFFFLQYILTNFSSLDELVNKKRNYYRDKARSILGGNLHPRQYQNAAEFMLGIYIFHKFAKFHKAITKAELIDLNKSAFHLILTEIEKQDIYIKKTTHHTLLCEYLNKQLKTRHYYLSNYSNEKQILNKANKSIMNIDKQIHIGWFDERSNSVYISSDEKILNEIFLGVPKDLKSILQVNKPGFWKKIKDENGLVNYDNDKTTIRRKPGKAKATVRVYYLNINL